MGRWSRSVAVVSIATLLACSEPNGPDAAEIIVSPTAVAIAQLETQPLTVSVVDEAGTLLTGIAVTFESEDETIATVSNLGVVTSVGPAGTTQLVLRAAGLEKEVPVTVTAVADQINVTPNPGVVPQKGTLQLDARLLDLNGMPVPGAVLTFTSGSPTIATVSGTGLVTSVGPAGQATIAIQSGAITGQVVVAVTQVPTVVTVGPDPITIGRGRDLQIHATVRDAVGEVITGAPLTFAASPADLLTVSGSGLLTAADALGTGTVSVRSGRLERVVPVTVAAVTHPQGEIVARTQTDVVSLYGVAFARNGRIAAGGLVGGVAVGTLPSFALASTQPGGQITAVAFSSSGRLFASGTPVDGVSELDPATGAVLDSGNGLLGTPYELLVSPDEQTLYLGTSDGRVYFIDVGTLAVLHEVQVGGSLVHLALHPSLPLLYASPQFSSVIFEINTETRVFRDIAIPPSAPQAIAVALDGSELYLANEGGSVEVIPIGFGGSAASIPVGCGAYGLALTPDGMQLYASCSIDGLVKIIDRASRTVVGTLTPGGTPRRVAVTPDGATVGVANEAGWVDFIQ
jgi:DNA-binding beta-propeller fold protein YncE